MTLLITASTLTPTLLWHWIRRGTSRIRTPDIAKKFTLHTYLCNQLVSKSG